MLRRDHRHGAGCADFTSPGSEVHYAPDLGLEPSHLDVSCRIDLEKRSIQGSVITTVVCRHQSARQLTLDAVDLEDVQVTCPDGLELTWSYDGERVRVCWAQEPTVGDQRRVRVDYRVVDPITGMDFSWPDDAYPDRAKFALTDHETERARYWLPCLDHPAVRTPLDLHVRAGAEYTILANGMQTGEEPHDDGTRTVHWKLEQPCPSYLLCVAVGDFVRAEGGRHEDVEIAFFAPTRYSAEDLQRSFDRTREMMAWMTAKLGAAFPFPKYYQVAVPGIGGAMENISLTTWDDAFVLDEVLASEWTRLVDRINVHEMAHSYFGDAIVIRDFAHAWLKESWATYMEALWVEDTHGEDELFVHLHHEAADYMRESDERYARPIVTREFNSSWDMFDQHLYPGGCWRIHMLRKHLGEEAFWAAVQDYVASYTGKLVETSDFRRKLEDHSGLSLGKFFDQWLHRPGYPKLKVEVSHDADRGEARLVIEQTQVNTKKEPKPKPFELELEVAFEVAADEWERHRIPVTLAKHTLVLPLTKRPLQTVVDPALKVLKRLEFDPGKDQLKRSLTQGPVPGRIHAAQTLAKAGKPSGIAAIEAAWKEEPSWGVRAVFAKSLGASGSQRAAVALAKLLLHEEDPRVLAPLAEACGKYRDPQIAQALRAFVEKEPPYLARAAAYRALGSQRGEEHLDLLERGAQDDSWWGWVRRGAMTGLGSTRTERAWELLRERTAYGRESLQVRVSALPALAEAATWQEKGRRQETLEALADLTRDREYRVRVAAAKGLAALGESGADAALEALTHQLAKQDEPWLRRIMSGLERASPGRDSRKTRKKADELESKLRKLALRVETLESRAKKKNNDG